MQFAPIPLNGQTWLICGGRDFADRTMFKDVMLRLIYMKGCPSKIVHGGARGADEMAAEWGRDHALEVVAMDPDWRTHGKAAGPIRNRRMLDEHKPALVVAFPGGTGTANMIEQSRLRGVDVAEIVAVKEEQG